MTILCKYREYKFYQSFRSSERSCILTIFEEYNSVCCIFNVLTQFTCLRMIKEDITLATDISNLQIVLT